MMRARAYTSLGAIFGAVCLAVGLTASPAHAGHEQYPFADNGDHYMDRVNLTSYGDAAAVHGRDQLNRAAGFNATFSGTGDAEIHDYAYGDTGWHGRTSCTDWLVYGLVCDEFYVKFNLSSMGTSMSRWRSLGCHELGHTVHLGHRDNNDDSNDNSCMRVEIWPEDYDNHDLDVIEAAY